MKEENGWTPYYVVGNDTGALILLKKIIFGFNLAYIPKGPLGENWQELWDYLDRFCKQHHVAILKVEPDIGKRIRIRSLQSWLVSGKARTACSHAKR